MFSLRLIKASISPVVMRSNPKPPAVSGEKCFVRIGNRKKCEEKQMYKGGGWEVRGHGGLSVEGFAEIGPLADKSLVGRVELERGQWVYEEIGEVTNLCMHHLGLHERLFHLAHLLF